MTTPVAPEVALVVVTYHSGPLLPAFVAALPAALEGVAYWRLVVVDSASTDDTADVARRLAPDATVVVLQGNRGYAAGVNAGVAVAAGAAAVLVLNPDIRMGPGCVRRLLDALSPDVGIVVPRLLEDDGSQALSLRREPTVLRALAEAVVGGRLASRLSPLGEVVGDPGAYEHAGTAAWATGAAMLMSRRCLQVVGPWDETFFLYSEETDFALRARDAGLVLRYVPDAVATHLGGEGSVSPRLWSMKTWNRVRLYRKRHGVLPALAYRAAVTLNEALRAARGSPTHRAGLRVLLRPGTRPPELAGARVTAAGSRRRPATVCFAAQDWWYHNRAHSDVQLMRALAADSPVLFVNSIGMRMPLPGRSSRPWRRILRKLGSVARYVRRPLPDVPNFIVLSPLPLPLYGSRAGEAIGAWLVRVQVLAVARALRLEPEVVVVTIPTAWDVARRMPRRTLVFNRADRHSAFPEADRAAMERLERALLTSADLVVYASRALQAEEAALTGERAAFLDHGVDLEHFRHRPAHEEPADLRAIAHPRVGFFGALDDFLVDLDLLEQLARELPEANLVLVGDATCDLSRLQALPNVYWLGFRDYALIPSYGSGFDVAIMPWLRNEWIRAANPIKLKEYLALGLPVVSTPFDEVRHWRRWVEVAETPQEFVAAVRKALGDHDPAAAAQRRRAVESYSWSGRARLLDELVNGVSGTEV